MAQIKMFISYSYDVGQKLENLHDQNLEPVVVAQPFSKYFPIDHYQDIEVYKLKFCVKFKQINSK